MTGSPSPSQKRAGTQEGALDRVVQKPCLESAVWYQPPTLFSGPWFPNGYVRGWVSVLISLARAPFWFLFPRLRAPGTGTSTLDLTEPCRPPKLDPAESPPVPIQLERAPLSMHQPRPPGPAPSRSCPPSPRAPD